MALQLSPQSPPWGFPHGDPSLSGNRILGNLIFENLLISFSVGLKDGFLNPMDIKAGSFYSLQQRRARFPSSTLMKETTGTYDTSSRAYLLFLKQSSKHKATWVGPKAAILNSRKIPLQSRPEFLVIWALTELVRQYLQTERLQVYRSLPADIA